MKPFNDIQFSLKYNGIPFKELQKTRNTEYKGNQQITVYTLSDGLKITNITTLYEPYGAYGWVNYFENTGKNDSEILSEIYDCDFNFPFEPDEKPLPGYFPSYDSTKIYNAKGSDQSATEFFCDAEKASPDGVRDNYIFEGDEKTFAPDRGRSSNGTAPFFDVNRKESGIIFAIGWTGQWQCKISRNKNSVNVKTGLENAAFRLHPGEKVRTTSFLSLSYNNGQTAAHNLFRRLIKTDFSLIGKPGRDAQVPFSELFWGGMPGAKIADCIEKISAADLGYEYIWVDAGWYGKSDKPCNNVFEGDWSEYLGDWDCNPYYHPKKLQDVSDAAHKCGKKFLLWFEPERALYTAPIAKEHPEYFFFQKNEVKWYEENLLLNLGNSEAWNWCYKMLCEKIESLNIDCYRQDFNSDPLFYWTKNDAPDRLGINEIAHITGLYKLWDALLEKFPNLIIDNCASGGRRIDIETLKRSVPLWRSDCYCLENQPAEISQMHNQSFSWWIPYSGTGVGKHPNDTYKIRSCYSSGMSTPYFYTEDTDYDLFDEETINWIRRTNNEYLKVRPYFSCDYYPLTEFSTDNGGWTALQFDRKENHDGILLIFRRKNSNAVTYKLSLSGIKTDSNYEFTDADTDKKIVLSGKELNEKGYFETITDKRTAKLYFYREI